MSHVRRIIQTTKLIAALTLASRVLGVMREMVFAHYFGAGAVLSAFRVAFMVPNLARRLFGEGALSSSLIPTLSDVLHREGEEPARRLAGTILLLLAVFLGAVILLAEILLLTINYFVDDLTLELTALMAPYMALICVAAVAGGVLNVKGRFAVPAAAPTVLNVFIIAAAWLGARRGGLEGAALVFGVGVAVVAAGAVQMSLQLWALRRIGFAPLPTLNHRAEAVRRVFRLMGPMILGLSAVQIGTLLDYLMALFLVKDASGEAVGPSVLGYAQYLYQLPLGVFGIALATAIFPVLAEKAALDDRAGVAEVVGRGLRLALFISLPASVGMILVSFPLVEALFERGEFGPSDTRRVGWTLICYVSGVTAYFAQHVVVRAYYALKDGATPVRAAGTVVALNFFLGLGLVLTPLRERGLALATALTAYVQVGWLLARLKRHLPDLPFRSLASGAARMAGAAAIMALTVILVDRVEGVRHAPAAPRLGALIAAGAGSYLLACRFLKIEELQDVLARSRASSSRHSIPLA